MVFNGFLVFGYPFIPGNDDGLVPVWSVNSQDNFQNICYVRMIHSLSADRK
jgi:hypothetical protein